MTIRDIVYVGDDRLQQVATPITEIPVHLKVDNLLARVFWHEIDHLNGRLYTDRIVGSDALWQVENTAVDTTTN